MNSLARQDENALTFVTTVVAFASLVAVDSIVHWRGNRFVLLEYVILGALASALKTRLPGIPGTISVNCIVLALGITQLTTPQLVALSVECGLVERWWGSNEKISRRQLTLYAGVFAIAAGVAGWTHNALPRFAISPLASLLAAGCLLFGSLTAGLSWYSAVTAQASPAAMWSKWLAWSFPYYLLNIGLAALIVAFSPMPPPVAGLTAAFALSIFVVYRRFLSSVATVEAARV